MFGHSKKKIAVVAVGLVLITIHWASIAYLYFSPEPKATPIMRAPGCKAAEFLMKGLGASQNVSATNFRCGAVTPEGPGHWQVRLTFAVPGYPRANDDVTFEWMPWTIVGVNPAPKPKVSAAAEYKA